MPPDMTRYIVQGNKPGQSIPRSPYTQSPAQLSPTPSSPSHPALDSVVPAGVVPAAEPTQDTGMIQRARVGRATLILTIAFVASRILGLVQSSMFAFVFGTTSVSDAYT